MLFFQNPPVPVKFYGLHQFLQSGQFQGMVLSQKDTVGLKMGRERQPLLDICGVDHWPSGKILEGSEKASPIYVGKTSLRISSCIDSHKERVRGDDTEEVGIARA